MNLGTSIVRFQIVTILVGLALEKAASAIVSSNKIFTTIALAYFVVNLLNFYHAKIVTTEDEEYKTNQRRKPLQEMTDFVLNSTLMGSFLFIPLYADAFLSFLIANFIMRLLDMALIVFNFRTTPKTERGKAVIRAHRYWAIYNSFTMSILLGFAALLFFQVTTEQLWMPIVLLATAILDVILDYKINWSFYFPASSTKPAEQAAA